MKKLKVITYWTENGMVDKIEFDRLDVPWWMPKWLFFKVLSDKLSTSDEETDLIREVLKKMEEKLKEDPEMQNLDIDDVKISISCYHSKMFMFVYYNDEDANIGMEMIAY